MAAGAGIVTTQLIVDASGAKQGVADFQAAMAKAKASAIDAGTATASSFEQAQKRWQQSLAATDPVIRAQIRMEQELQKQRDISARALQLGIGTQQAHAAQLEKVRTIQQGYVNDAMKATEVTTGFGKALQGATLLVAGLVGVMSAGAVVNFAKSVFTLASSLDEMAQQAGVSTEGLQAYRAVMLQNGIDADQTAQILTKLTRNIGEAEASGGKARDAFVKLGIGLDTLKGGAEDTLPAVARGLLGIEDASERAKLEVDLFGKTGQRLESALKALIDPTSTLIEKQRALGQIMGTDVTNAADNAADRLEAAWNRIKTQSAGPITSVISMLADLNDWLDKVGAKAPGVALLEAMRGAPAAASKPGGIPSLEGPLLINGRPGGYSTDNLDGVLSKLREQADLTGKSASDVARTVALREADAAKIKDGNGHLTEAERLEISRLAVAKTGYEAAKKAGEDRAKEAKKQQDDLDHFEDTITKLSHQNDEIAKKKREDADKLRQDQADYIQDLNDEVKLAGMNRLEAERYNAVLQGARQFHIEIGSEQSKQIEAAVALRQETEQYRDLVDDIQGGFQSMFRNVFEGGVKSFSDLWGSVKSMFFDMLAKMAAQALVAPIIIPLVQSFGGSAAGMLSGASGGSSPLSLLSNGSSLLSGGSGGGGFLSSIFGTAGMGEAYGGGDFIGTAAGNSSWLGSLSTGPGPLGSLGGGFGGFLGGAGIGALAGNLVFGNKNSASIGSMGGAATGALIGSIVPGLGTVLGGLIGGLAGGGLGSMTGTSNQGAISNFTNNGAGNTLFKAGGGNNGQLATQATSAVNAIVQQLMDAGISVAMGNVTGLSIGSDKSYVYGADGMKEKLAGGEAGVQATITSILNKILPSASGGDDITSGILAKYQANGGLNAGNITQLAQEIQQAKQDKEQADTAAAELKAQVEAFGPAIDSALKAITDPVGAQLDQLLAGQKARAAQAEAYGYDVSKLTALNDAELNKFLKGLTKDELAGLSGTLSQAGEMAAALQAQIDAQNKLADGYSALTDRMQDLGDQVQKGAQAAQKAADGWASARDALTGASRGIGLSDPALSPTDRYMAAQTERARLFSSAQSGNAADATSFAGYASSYLQASLAYNGSTAAYAADRASVQGQLDQLATFSEGQRSLAQQQADSLTAMLTKLQEISGTLKSSGQETAEGLAAVTAAVDEVGKQIKDTNLLNLHSP